MILRRQQLSVLRDWGRSGRRKRNADGSYNSAMLVISLTASSSTVITDVASVLVDLDASGAPPRTLRLFAARFAFSWSFFISTALMGVVA